MGRPGQHLGVYTFPLFQRTQQGELATAVVSQRNSLVSPPFLSSGGVICWGQRVPERRGRSASQNFWPTIMVAGNRWLDCSYLHGGCKEKGGQGFAITGRSFQRVLIILEGLAVGKCLPGSFCGVFRSWKPINCYKGLGEWFFREGRGSDSWVSPHTTQGHCGRTQAMELAFLSCVGGIGELQQLEGPRAGILKNKTNQNWGRKGATWVAGSLLSVLCSLQEPSVFPLAMYPMSLQTLPSAFIFFFRKLCVWIAIYFFL